MIHHAKFSVRFEVSLQDISFPHDKGIFLRQARWTVHAK